jgi:uncharacterized protein
LTRAAIDWIKAGTFGRWEIVLIAIISALSGIALIVWYIVVKPDIADLTAKIPSISPFLLVALGLLFAITNAISEELIWRGFVFRALERAVLPGSIVIGIQAISFGLMHLHGFPRGASGIVLATIYGVMLGYLRQRANGLFAPIAAHIFADAVIYIILIFVVFAV